MDGAQVLLINLPRLNFAAKKPLLMTNLMLAVQSVVHCTLILAVCGCSMITIYCDEWYDLNCTNIKTRKVRKVYYGEKCIA